MRILHLMNTPLSPDELRSGGKRVNASGGWMAALLAHMLQDTDFSLACVSFGNVKEVQASHEDRIDSYIIPGDLIGRSVDRTLRICRDLVSQWSPDIIHIHGTESCFGLLTARNMVKCPAVISLQGLLGPCSEWYRYFGNLSLFEIARSHRLAEIIAMRGLWIKYWNIRKMARREKEIIAGNNYFMGRTNWDRAFLRAMNPMATYYQENRILREAFWRGQWEIQGARRCRVIFTNAGGYPRKGTEVLLDAFKLLKYHYPDIQVAIAGGISHRSGYGRYLRNRIKELGNAGIELGQLNAEQLVKELLYSHVFVSPSYIDNSPNSVSEAQLLGMPVISTYTGGVPSLIEEGRTGLFFPTGDASMLASRLRDIFESDALAIQLGNYAREAATRRHNPDTITQQVVTAYEDILRRTA